MSNVADLARNARDRDLPFLLIGGYAVNIHGYSRVTNDLDVLIRRAQLDQWTELLNEAGYKLVHEGQTFVQFESSEPATPVDLMLVNDQTFEKLQARVHSLEEEGTTIPFVCVQHLIALKIHVLKQDLEHRRMKDFLDVVELVRANKIDLQSTEMREIFERYGSEDLYRRIKLASE